MKNSKQIPGNAIDWILKAKNIADRIYHFRGLGFIMLADRTAGNAWTVTEKQCAQQILMQVERDAVRYILTRWVQSGKITPCRMIQHTISSSGYVCL